MDDLTLVGVHDDGEHVVLAGAGGQQYLLRVDEALRAAVRRDRARLGQLQIENGGRLRPRDVQARIRAGQTAEEVAAEAGVPMDYVRRYEGPVLAEREFVAHQAREIRSRHGVGPGPTLGEVVADRLVLREAGDDVSWDAWRTEEAAWVVVVSFTAGGKRRQAQWAYDAQLRHIAPLDDEARWFTEADPGLPGQLPSRRLTSVPDGVVELPDGTAGEPEHLRPDGDGHPVPVPVSTGPDLLDTLRERRGRRSPPVPPSEEDGAGPDPVREAIDSLLSRTPELEQVPDQRFEHRSEHRSENRSENRSEQRSERWSSARSGPGTEHRADVRPDPSHPGYGVLDPYFEPAEPPHRPRGGTGEPEVLVLPDADPLPGPGVRHGEKEPAGVPAGSGARSARRPRRASVPSWDDIVFGSRRD